MRYASIRKMDISNGPGLGISLFVQGCHFHCRDCFNSDAWDFNGGYEWTKDIQSLFIDMIKNEFINRVSILGGEPLADENLKDVCDLITILKGYKNKKIWLWSGYKFDDIFCNANKSSIDNLRYYTIMNCDYMIDGQFIKELYDFNLKYRGSSNQRVIDIKASSDNIFSEDITNLEDKLLKEYVNSSIVQFNGI